MTGQQLKKSILQMAVQGKLVSQDPNDEPASVLLEKIRKEKEELIKEGKIKKEKKPSYIFRGTDNLPYERVGKNEPVCIADEVPFEIPESWEWVRWGTLSESIQYGYNAPAQENGRIKMVRISDIQDNSVMWETVPYCDIKEGEIDAYLLKPNDILFARTGGTVGKSYLVQEVPEEAIYAGYLIRTRYSNQLCPQYLKYFMESELYWSQLREGTIATAQPNCNGKTLGNMLVPIPPSHEQIRIVEKLNAVMAHVIEYGTIDSRSKHLNNIFPDRLKKSILQEAVQGKLVPQDPNDEPAAVLLERIRAEKQRLIAKGKIKKDKHESVIFRRDNSHYEKRDSEEVCIDEEIPFDIPDSWAWFRLRTVLQQASTGPFGSMLHKNDYTFEGVPIINPADIKDGEISSTKIKKVSYETAQRLSSYMLHFGDVIIGRRGEMGRSAAIDTQQEGWLCGTGCFYVTPLSVLSPNYLVFFLKSPYAKTLLIDNSVGTTMNNLNHSILGNMLIPLPPIAEQIKIISQYEAILSILDA